MSNIGSGASNTVLQGGGAGQPPKYSTATFPGTATGTGTILRADGTNWVATTSTYPNTNAVSTLLYASSANVMAALTTANSGVLTTDASGVPSIDTTNFVRQTTGMQVKGNNTNTAPPAGFIGQEIISTVAAGSLVTLTGTGTATDITTITVTAGVWDITGLIVYANGVTYTAFESSLSLTTGTGGTVGDNMVPFVGQSTAVEPCGFVIPPWRQLFSTNTTVYLVAKATYSGTGKAYGKIRAVRVG